MQGSGWHEAMYMDILEKAMPRERIGLPCSLAECVREGCSGIELLSIDTI